MKNLTTCYWPSAIVILASLFAIPDSVVAQRGDSVFMYPGSNGRSSVRRGQITSTTPNSVDITLSGGKKEQIVPGRIKKISFAGEPTQLGRARDRMNAGRYDDCLSELEKITETPSSILIVREMEFMAAFSKAQQSLRGGSVTAKVAGKGVKDFLTKHPNSHHFYEMTLVLGQLFLAINEPDLAELEFARLSQSNWPADVIKGHFNRGKSLIHGKNLQQAHDSFKAIIDFDSNDDIALRYKLIARCQIAKVMAMQGKHAEAKVLIDKIITEENADDSELFAYAYNALGHCHLQANRPKDAAFAFLFTQLLFRTEADPHAEAVYNLALIWKTLEETDRANRARALLKSRYRNTIWAPKLS